MGPGSQRKDDAAVRAAAAVKLRSPFKSPQKSRSAVARAKKGARFKVTVKASAAPGRRDSGRAITGEIVGPPIFRVLGENPTHNLHQMEGWTNVPEL
jgi:hypothetical protein